MQLKRKLEKQGFTVERTGSGHWKATKPGYPGHVIFAFSPSGSGLYQTIKRLRELGYKP